MHPRTRITVVLVLVTLAPLLAQQPSPPTPLPVVEVRDQAGLTEEAGMGPYDQPEWTTHRRFPSTRVYLQKAPWEAGFEQWWRGRFYKGGKAQHLLQEEIEVGLPYRTQVDLYENWVGDEQGRFRHHDVAAELRWAVADWGKLPLNPTLYAEWKSVDQSQGADVFEIKLLLGEQLAPRWHWGFNAAYEQEVGNGRATELAWSQAVSYSVIDRSLSLGVETVFRYETSRGSRGDPEISFLLGPSAQWRPCSRVHLDVSPLIGVTHDAPRVEAFCVLGIDLWGPKKSRQLEPNALRGQ